MVNTLLGNLLRVKNSKRHGNEFYFSHKERCLVVYLLLILMEICFFAISMDI